MKNIVITPYSFSAAVRRLGLIDHIWQHMNTVVVIPPEDECAAVLVANAISQNGLTTRKLRWAKDVYLGKEGGEFVSFFVVDDSLTFPEPVTVLPDIEKIGDMMEASSQVSVFFNAELLRYLLLGMGKSSASLELVQGNQAGSPWSVIRVSDGESVGILAPKSQDGKTGFNRTTPLVMGCDGSLRKPHAPWVLFGNEENDPSHGQDCYFAIPLRANQGNRWEVYQGDWCAQRETWLQGDDATPSVFNAGIPRKLGIDILYCDASHFESCLDACRDLHPEDSNEAKTEVS